MPLKIVVPERQLFNEADETIIRTPETTLILEHSLISLSRWEMKWKEPFLSKVEQRPGEKEFTREQLLYYYKCMTMNTKEVDPNVYAALGEKEQTEILDYMKDPMTAATITDHKRGGRGNRGFYISSETIYSWMIDLEIPMECEKWHLNRLMALIKYRSADQDSDKMPRNEVRQLYRDLNRQRRASHHTRG